MTMAKGISSGYVPAAAVAVRESLFEPFTVPGNAFGHLLTFGGNAVAAAGSLANIEIIENEKLADRSAEMGAYLHELVQGLSDHPTVGDIRGGMGLMVGIDLVKNKQTRESWGSEHPFIKTLGARMQERGVITRIWDVIHLAPPLVIEKAELELIVETIDSCLTELEAEYSAEIE
jgi:adenosylmethionine-8-amino-7-oxononanoate aminotransferase